MPLREIVIGRDEEDREKYGKKGAIYFGKHLVGEGEDANLTNPVHLDVARPHVSLICGKRGQGKSYTGAVIAEEFFRLPDEIRQNLSMLMIDVMGIWWSLKNPNEQQLGLLKDWGLEPDSFDASVYVPKGFVEDYRERDIPFDDSFSIKASELSTQDWSLAFDISLTDPLGVLLERVMRNLKDKEDYGIEGIIKAVMNDERASEDVKQALENRFLSAKEWGIFSKEGLSVEEILSPGKVSVLDMSHFGQLSSGWSVRGLLVGLLSRRIYEKRVEARRKEEISTIRGRKEIEVPMTWVVADEAHNFLPAEGETPASGPLTTLVKEGRQPGISVCLITQRPGAIHPNAISQSDLIISHRLTARPDLEALRNIMQTYMTFDIKDYINDLPRKKGSAIILDDNSERIYSMKVRPRMSWHAGGTPSAFEEEEKF
ncbi:MAG: ATP-binding protein [Candidatus Aenigmatarchaeota archaeon]